MDIEPEDQTVSLPQVTQPEARRPGSFCSTTLLLEKRCVENQACWGKDVSQCRRKNKINLLRSTFDIKNSTVVLSL